MRRMISLILTLALLCALPLGGSAEHVLNSVAWKKPVPVERIEQITQPILRLAVGNRMRLDCRVLPENADNPALLWSSSNESVAAVDDGNLVCVGAGKCIVTAEAADGSGVQAQWRLTVEAAKVQAIRPVTQSPCHLRPGGTITLAYRIQPESLQGAPLSWRSSDERVATVADGVVTCAGEGRCTITASADGTSASRTWQIHAAEHFLYDGELTEAVAIPGTDLRLRLPEGWHKMNGLYTAARPEIDLYDTYFDTYGIYGELRTSSRIVFVTGPAPDGLVPEMIAEAVQNRGTFEEQLTSVYGIPAADIIQMSMRASALPEGITMLAVQFSVANPATAQIQGYSAYCGVTGVFLRGDTLVGIAMTSADPTLLAEGAATDDPFTGDAVSILYEDFLAILETLSAGL